MTSCDPAPLPRFDVAFGDQLAELFRWRRDVRHFRTDALPAGMIETLLDLANLSPSVGLSQPWRFVTVDAPERRAAIRHNFEACNAQALSAQADGRAATYARLKLAGLDQAPCHLAVFVEDDPVQGGGLGRRTMPETVAFSAVMAVHTLWLAACAAGIGLGWISILDPREVTAALDVPLEWRFLGYFCLGYPAVAREIPELETEGWETRHPVRWLTR